ncbi:hypothetical protein GCM10010464_37410 [Pseudonocardia yunnanensis]
MSLRSPNEWTCCLQPDNGGNNRSSGRMPFAIFFPEPGKTLAQRSAFDGPVHPGGADPLGRVRLRSPSRSTVTKTKNHDTCMSRVSTSGRNDAAAAWWPGLRTWPH